jgi:four helix bundle protein
MTSTTSFRDLDVWQESMLLVEEIYAVSRSFPRDEQYGLTAQLRKAAVSIPSNIGEGARRKRRRVTLNHYDIALGSQGEVDVQIELAKRLGFCTIRPREASGARRSHRQDAERTDHVAAAGRPLAVVPHDGGVVVNNHQPPTTNHQPALHRPRPPAASSARMTHRC